MKRDDPGTSAAERWLTDYGDTLYRYALSLVRDRNRAEELVQETFLAGLKSAQQFEGRSSPRTWLMGILRHKAFDYFRNEAKKATHHPLDESEWERNLFDEKGGWRQPPSRWPRDPYQILQNEDFHKVLAGCLDGLAPLMRSVLVLRAFEGLSGQQVCKELEITATHMWVLTHRARERLRRCLDERWFSAKPD